MGDNLPATLTPSKDQAWGRLVTCLNSLESIDISQTIKIGRSQVCDVVISDSLMEANDLRGGCISKMHCMITKDIDDKIYLTDLSKNGTFLNGIIIGRRQKVVLQNDDKIGCCKVTFFVFKSLTMEPELPTTLTASNNTPLDLTIPNNSMWGRLVACLAYLGSIDLSKPVFKVGRSSCCDGVIEKFKIKDYFSKEHFVLAKDPDTSVAYITDLSSKGTYLNGRLIGKGCKNILQDNDTIAVGHRKKIVYSYKSMGALNAHYLPTELRKRYEPCKFIGRGACGEVRLAFEKYTCNMYAIKSILKSRSTTSQMDKINHPSKIRTEIGILKALSHPFIIRMEDIVETHDEVFIVLEYMHGGELSNRILSTEPLTESNTKFFFYQMALAVDYLHSYGIAHRDLKPENVLLLSDAPETILKVSDFGLSKITDEDMMQTMCGTWYYVAPEILKSSEHRKYDKQVDVWSLGVILFFMLSKQLPFNCPEKSKLPAVIKKGTYVMEEAAWNGVSFQAKDLVSKMLTVDPQKRITVGDILKHPWLEKDISMQYRVQSLVEETFPNAISVFNVEPPTKRVRLSSDESSV